MVRPGRERLTGLVEVDETYWGAEEEGVIGRQTERFAVAAEERGTGLRAAKHSAALSKVRWWLIDLTIPLCLANAGRVSRGLCAGWLIGSPPPPGGGGARG